jgi:hypothetical protein
MEMLAIDSGASMAMRWSAKGNKLSLIKRLNGEQTKVETEI